MFDIDILIYIYDILIYWSTYAAQYLTVTLNKVRFVVTYELCTQFRQSCQCSLLCHRTHFAVEHNYRWGICTVLWCTSHRAKFGKTFRRFRLHSRYTRHKQLIEEYISHSSIENYQFYYTHHIQVHHFHLGSRSLCYITMDLVYSVHSCI